MKKVIVTLCVLVLGVAAKAQSVNHSNNGSEQLLPYVAVTSQAEREVEPDQILVGITIDDSAGGKNATVEMREAAMIKTLDDIGINTAEQLSVSSMTGNLQEFFLKKDKVFSVKHYTLLLHDAATLTKVFEILAKQNITRVSIERTDISNKELIDSELREEAMQSAQKSASELAAAVGQSIGRARYINATAYRSAPLMRNYDFAENMVVTAYGTQSAPVIKLEKIKISCSVEVYFALNTYK